MTFEEYKKLPGINASFLKACSFGHYAGWKYLNLPPFESDAMAFGTAVHALLLEPDKFESMCSVVPADAPKKPTSVQVDAFQKFDTLEKPTKAQVAAYEKNKAAIEWWKSFEFKTSGKVVLDKDEWAKLQQIARNCLSIERVALALNTFEKEKTYVFGDGKFKSRLDLVDEKNGVVIDLKTTRDASPREFTKQLLSLRYELQMYHYCKAINATTAYVVAIESETAEVALYDCTDIVFSDFTKNRYEMALKTAEDVLSMSECPRKFSTDIMCLKLPEWVKEEV